MEDFEAPDFYFEETVGQVHFSVDLVADFGDQDLLMFF